METEDYICNECGSEFSITFDSGDKPTVCPFCSTSLEEDDSWDEDNDPYEDSED